MTILHFLQCGHFLTDSLKVGGAKGHNHTHHITRKYQSAYPNLLPQEQIEMVQKISPKLAPDGVPGRKEGGRGREGEGEGEDEELEGKEGRLCQYPSFSIDEDLLIFVDSLIKNSYILWKQVM